MTNKYELTDEKIQCGNHTLYRIKAIKDFGNIKKDKLGGFIESEYNLSQKGNAWVHGNAMVFGYAQVFEDAEIYDNAQIYENAKIYENAMVCNNVKIRGEALVSGNARILKDAQVYGNAWICNEALISGRAIVCEDSRIYENAFIDGYVQVLGNARVCGNAGVHDNSIISGGEVYGRAYICGDAIIKEISDYIVFKNFWSSGRYFTYTRSNKMWSVGCFYGTGDQLIEKAYKDSEISGRNYERIVRYVEEIEKEEFKSIKE